MVEMANGREGKNLIEDYSNNLPEGNEYKALMKLLGGSKSYLQEDADSTMQMLKASNSPEAQTLLGILMLEQGDTIAGRNMIKEAAERECTLAELFMITPNHHKPKDIDMEKLASIAERIPLAYSILGDLYYKPDENGNINKELAIKYYLKAEEHALLEAKGARRVLEFYKNGGNIQLSEDDIKRLELIVEQEDKFLL